jgi:hypothetical protein
MPCSPCHMFPCFPAAQVLGVCRTEHMHPTLLSVVVQEGMVSDGRGGAPEMRPVTACLAYLIDLQVGVLSCYVHTGC